MTSSRIITFSSWVLCLIPSERRFVHNDSYFLGQVEGRMRVMRMNERIGAIFEREGMPSCMLAMIFSPYDPYWCHRLLKHVFLRTPRLRRSVTWFPSFWIKTYLPAKLSWFPHMLPAGDYCGDEGTALHKVPLQFHSVPCAVVNRCCL